MIEQPFYSRRFGADGDDETSRQHERDGNCDGDDGDDDGTSASWCCGMPVDALAQGVNDAVWQLARSAPGAIPGAQLSYWVRVP